MEPLEEEQGLAQNVQPTKASTSSHIRSRITVVCAECKRLKLKCDRRLPCGSCVKRDTVDRCKYSQAATEKVDLQSVHNRVLALESQVASLSSNGSMGKQINDHNRALLATGNSGSSLAISLDDVTSVWLSHLSCASGIKLKLETAPVEPQTDDFPPAILFPSISTFYASPSPLEPPSVTSQLMSRLPSSSEARNHLLAALEDTLAMHPSFNFPHFQTRITRMFQWAKEVASTSFRDPLATDNTSSIHTSSKPTLSFFAAASAGFALGALVTKTNHNPITSMMLNNYSSSAPTSGGDPTCSPWALFSLSEQALSVFEKSYNYDLDYLIAMVLQVVFLLHGGKSRVSHTLLPLVGKMVNVARVMGLGIDPDDFPGTYPLFEAETRRRIWWEVFYYDLFVSDFMGQLPLIPDNSFTTRMPADVDEGSFNPSQATLPLPDLNCSHHNVFFGIKCRLAQLVKNLKKRAFRDPSTDSDSAEFSIEEAAEHETLISQFLTELPPEYRGTHTTDTTEESHKSLTLAHASEVAIIANRLIITLYLPFLKSNPSNPPHQASLATVNAAHKIIQTTKAWRAGDDQRAGSLGVYYEYGRMLFDAAVVCASMGIDAHDSAFAQCIKDDVGVALELMKQMEGRQSECCTSALDAGTNSRLERNVSEAVTVLKLLKDKADATRVGMGGLKRKRQEIEKDHDVSVLGLMLPYVGAGITSSSSLSGVDAPTSPLVVSSDDAHSRNKRTLTVVKVKSEATSGDVNMEPKKRIKEKLGVKNKAEREPDKSTIVKESKVRDKGPKHPAYGIRVRPGHAPPYVQNHDSSESPSATLSANSPAYSGISDGPVTLSLPPSLTKMLPPSSTTPSSLRAHTPIQSDNQMSYYTRPSFSDDGSVHMQDDNPQSLQGIFESSDDSHMRLDERYNAPVANFFQHTYTNPATSSSSQPSPSFSSTQVLQYGYSSQPQRPGYYSDYPAFDASTLRVDVPEASPSVHSVQNSDCRSPSGPFMGSPTDMSTMSMFANPETSTLRMPFKGDIGIDTPKGQDWLSPAVAGPTTNMTGSYFSQY